MTGMQHLLVVAFILLGCVVGGCLNICISVLIAKDRGVAFSSSCANCQRRSSAIDLAPVLGYLALRGVCPDCHHPLPKRAIAVEVTTGAVMGLLYAVFGLGTEFGVAVLWACLFILISAIDIERGLILNVVVYPSMAIAVCFAVLLRLSWLDGWGVMSGWPRFWVAALGGGVGLVLFLMVALCAVVVTGKEGMGWGDVKLAVLIGLVCGFPLILFVATLAALVGAVMAIVRFHASRGKTIPFGPPLALGAVIAIMTGSVLRDWLTRLH